MAVIERNREIVERDGVQGVFITRDELREYRELQAKRDRSENSLRAQMRTQNQEKIEFARKVAKFMELAGLDNLTALAGKSAEELLDRANEILAEE